MGGILAETAIGAVTLMLEHLGEGEAAALVPGAIRRAAQSLPPAGANSGLSTPQVGDLVREALAL